MATTWQISTLVLAVLGYALGIGCAVHALMTKTRSASSALAWILLCLSLPLVGSVFYLTIGQDRLGRRRESDLRASRAAWRIRRPERRPSGVRMSHADEEGPLFMEEVIERIAGEPVIGGNAADVYVGGERAYPVLLDAIEEARETLHVQFYIFDDDRIGKEFRNALVRKAGQGVEVRVLYDAVGCSRNWNGFWDGFRAGGVMAAPFMPLRPFKRRWQINLRNHRKILVADGRTAFTGSMNVGGRHVTSQGGRSYDLIARFRGPAAAAFDEVFARDWYYAAGEELAALPPTGAGLPDHDGGVRLQLLESGPDQEHGHFHLTLLSAIHQAKSSITLVTPYFVPDVSVMDALVLAGRRGVKLEVIVPERADSLLVRLASRDHLRQVLLAGGTVREKRGPMLHMKIALVDGDLALIGSSNLDNRSFFLNFELDVAVHGTRFASRIGEVLDDERKASRTRTVLEDLDQGVAERLLVRLASLFAPIL